MQYKSIQVQYEYKYESKGTIRVRIRGNMEYFLSHVCVAACMACGFESLALSALRRPSLRLKEADTAVESSNVRQCHVIAVNPLKKEYLQEVS